MTDYNEFANNEEEEKIINIQVVPGKMRKIQMIIAGVPKSLNEDILKKLKKSLGCGGHINSETNYLHLQGDKSFQIENELKKILPEYTVEFGLPGNSKNKL